MVLKKEKFIVLILKFQIIIKNIYLKLKIKKLKNKFKKFKIYENELKIYEENFVKSDKKFYNINMMRQFINIIKDIDLNISKHLLFQLKLNSENKINILKEIEKIRFFIFNLFLNPINEYNQYNKEIIYNLLKLKYKYANFNLDNLKELMKILNIKKFKGLKNIYKSLIIILSSYDFDKLYNFFEINSDYIKNKILDLKLFLLSLDEIHKDYFINNQEFLNYYKLMLKCIGFFK